MITKQNIFLFLVFVVSANAQAADWTFYNCVTGPAGTDSSSAMITVTWDPVGAQNYSQTYTIPYGGSYTDSTKAHFTSLVASGSNNVAFNNTSGSGTQSVALNNAAAPSGGGSFVVVPDSNGAFTLKPGTGCSSSTMVKKEEHESAPKK